MCPGKEVSILIVILANKAKGVALIIHAKETELLLFVFLIIIVMSILLSVSAWSCTIKCLHTASSFPLEGETSSIFQFPPRFRSPLMKSSSFTTYRIK